MPNRNYIKGRAAEYKVKKHMENKGYIVFRTPGSKSPVDLLCFRPYANSRLFIQVKAGAARLTAKKRKELVLWAERCDALPALALVSRGKIELEWIEVNA